MELLKELEPVMALISAVFSFTVIGLVIRISMMMRDAAKDRVEAVKDQKGVTEERLKLAQEELARKKDWYETEMNKLKVQLSTLLDEGKVSLENLLFSPGKLDIGSKIKEAIDSTLTSMQILEQDRKALTLNRDDMDPARHLEIAKAYNLEKNWMKAALHYDKYLAAKPDDWEAQLARAMAYANCRSGPDSDLLALAAYSETIARIPDGIDKNLRARLFSYRGAMLKRLKRLEEAENDLKLARVWAVELNELEDIAWNLAGVYALTGKKQELLAELRIIAHKPQWRDLIKSRHWWFGAYLDDPEVKKLLAGDESV